MPDKQVTELERRLILAERALHLLLRNYPRELNEDERFCVNEWKEIKRKNDKR